MDRSPHPCSDGITGNVNPATRLWQNSPQSSFRLYFPILLVRWPLVAPCMHACSRRGAAAAAAATAANSEQLKENRENTATAAAVSGKSKEKLQFKGEGKRPVRKEFPLTTPLALQHCAILGQQVAPSLLPLDSGHSVVEALRLKRFIAYPVQQCIEGCLPQHIGQFDFRENSASME